MLRIVPLLKWINQRKWINLFSRSIQTIKSSPIKWRKNTRFNHVTIRSMETPLGATRPAKWAWLPTKGVVRQQVVLWEEMER